jgi:hypothetical protein
MTTLPRLRETLQVWVSSTAVQLYSLELKAGAILRLFVRFAPRMAPASAVRVLGRRGEGQSGREASPRES